jgi:hypothetical protein
VRQHGNLSYIRTYQAGHSIPSYQPETAYKVFTRALFNLDIATGTKPTGEGANYTTTGRAVPDVQLEPNMGGLSYCYTYAASSCRSWQVDMIRNGSAEICNWLFVDANSTQLFPEEIAKCRADWAGGNKTVTRRVDSRQVVTGGAVARRGSWLLVVLEVVVLGVLGSLL